MVDVDAGVAMQEMLLGLVKMLVDEPEVVRVGMRVEEQYVHLHVSVAPKDVGKVIGRMGRTAKSLRTLTQRAGMKLGVVCDIDIEDPEEAGKRTRHGQHELEGVR